MAKKKQANQLLSAVDKILATQRKSDTMNDLETFYFAQADKLRENSPGPRHKVGAIIVHKGEIVGTGYNHPRNVDNVTFLSMSREEQLQEVIHAEDAALENAFITLSKSEAKDATMYVSGLWPCESCASKIAVYKIGIVKCQLKYNTPSWIVEGLRGAKILAAAGIHASYYT